MPVDFEEHLGPEARGQDVVVAFATDHMRQFQFGRALAGIGVPHVLMRDSSGRDYCCGIEGIGGPDDVVAYLRELAKAYRVTTTGVSTGAFGALWFGQLAPVHRMVVFSPLTGRGPLGDFHPMWHDRLMGRTVDWVMPDLREFYPNGPIPEAKAFVSDGIGCEIDRQMAERLGITDITLIPGHAHHMLARHMRDTGWFERLFRCPPAGSST